MATYFLNAEFNYPDELVRRVSDVVTSYATDAAKDLSIQKPFDIIIYPNHAWTDETGGVDGYAMSGGVLQIKVDLRNEKFKIDDVLGVPLKGTVFHEVNHIARWQGPGYGWTLLESTVSEGLATAYEKMIIAPNPVPHGEYEQDLDKLLSFYKNRDKEKDSTYNHNSWFLGFDPEYPKYLGYKVGTYIVETALENNPTLTLKELTTKTAEEVITLSGLVI